MADEIKDAKDGLKTLLETITGLRVYDHAPDSINEFPAAVIMFTGRTARDGMTLGGSSFTGRITVTLLVSKGDSLEAQDELDKYMAPLGSFSIEAAVDADNTWGSKVDDGRLVEVQNVGNREILEGWYVGADFMFEFIKQVTT